MSQARLSSSPPGPTPAPLYSVFCDEFGNTGSNLLDGDQPVFCYAFVILSPTQLADLSAELGRESTLGGEFKSAKLWSSGTGRKRLVRVANAVAKCGGAICLSLLEKRYHAATTAIEIYWDPETNERAPRELYIPRFRQRAADLVYDCIRDSTLADLLSATHRDNVNDLVDVGRQLATTLSFHPDELGPLLADTVELRSDKVFRYCRPREASSDIYSAPLSPTFNRPASQYAAFYPGLTCVDRYLRARSVEADLACDDDKQFGEALRIAFNISRRLDEFPESLAYAREGAIRCIRTHRLASSAAEVGIQLADLAAGVFGRSMSAAVRGRTLDEAQREVVLSWCGALLPRPEHYWMVADKMLDATCNAIPIGIRPMPQS